MSTERRVRVLIADDEANMRLTLSAILEDEGYDVSLAEDGLRAVEMCAKTDFDIILMDVRMPGMDGVEAFRQIRRHAEGVRVIMMSAYGMDTLKQTALEEGAIAFVDKPLDVEKIIQLMADATGTPILVVEDDAGMASSISEALKANGHYVTVTSSPHSALELVEQIHFDIILIDVQLPVMNGLDLYLAIKKITPTSVAVMISGMEEEFDRLAREAVRQTAYTIVRKPLELGALLELLSRIRRQSASDAIQKPKGNL